MFLQNFIKLNAKVNELSCFDSVQLMRSGDLPGKDRYLLKISAKPKAVAITSCSLLVVGCNSGSLVVFDLNLLVSFQGHSSIME